MCAHILVTSKCVVVNAEADAPFGSANPLSDG